MLLIRQVVKNVSTFLVKDSSLLSVVDMVDLIVETVVHYIGTIFKAICQQFPHGEFFILTIFENKIRLLRAFCYSKEKVL